MVDPSYEPAASIYPGKRNPVQQLGLWHILSSWFEPSFMVRQPIEELAERFRIRLEESWDDLDSVKMAYIEVRGETRRESYAIVRHVGRPVEGTIIWLIRDEHSAEAEPLFLRTFGLTEQDVVWRAGIEYEPDQ
ncbi:MAG TPA: hypothetical protein VHJ17_24865 [Thermomonospora sp.]|nr:hypothetical protein [Thermomonospora sp.]